MKLFSHFSKATLTASMILCAASSLRAEDPVIVYLVDPKEQAEIEQLNALNLDEGQEVPPPPGTKPELSQEASKRLDDLIRRIQERGGETDRYRRLADQAQKEQREFVEALKDYSDLSFNKSDPQASPEFVESTQKIAELVFKAPTSRDYYERLWLINAVWLENPHQPEKFEFLDRVLHDKSLEQEHRNRRIRSILITVGSIAGFALGGYLSFKASEKILPVVANEAGLASIAKYAGRATIILVGAGVGAGAGAYFGFLGSGFVFQNQREFLDPIEGNEDLRDILDYIDDLELRSGL